MTVQADPCVDEQQAQKNVVDKRLDAIGWGLGDTRRTLAGS